MKLVTKIATIATLASFMFAGVNLTWGNSYDDNNGTMRAEGSFGVHFDVNDNTTLGWELFRFNLWRKLPEQSKPKTYRSE